MYTRNLNISTPFSFKRNLVSVTNSKEFSTMNKKWEGWEEFSTMNKKWEALELSVI